VHFDDLLGDGEAEARAALGLGKRAIDLKAALEANMHHWQAEADAIEGEIQAQLRAGVPREQLSKQRKMADDCRTLACDASAKLAPYIHPRIGAVPVPNESRKLRDRRAARHPFFGRVGARSQSSEADQYERLERRRIWRMTPPKLSSSIRVTLACA
jgi:hypothetical protein